MYYPGRTAVICLMGITVAWSNSRADESSKYRLVDPDLKVVHIDSSPTESFLSIRADSMGRVFVGGREAIFVYEPSEDGGYRPRQELYRFPDHSWVYDIEIRGNDLYVLTLSALYLFEDGVIARGRLKPKRLIWGPPDWHVHQAFHGLAWGPEGDLYISMGDLMVWYGDYTRADHWGHWTMFSQPEGTRSLYTGAGGVFRCRPDGSQLQVVARGTRNSCGLVFDSVWNLFTNDNDHEGLPTEYAPGRLLHVTAHADFGWPRGWMRRKTPDRADLLETIVPDMGRAVPVGQTYYDEQYLPKRFRNNLLVARWGQRTITRYPLRARGASFEAEEVTLLEGFDKTRPVGVAVGRGGRLFVTLAYMAHNEGSPVYPSDLIMITRADDTDDHSYNAIDLTTTDSATLFDELASESSWPARRAHNEFLRRGHEVSKDAIVGKSFDGQQPRAARYLWLAAATAAHNGANERSAMVEMLENVLHEDADLAVQAVRVTGEFFANHARAAAIFDRALTHEDPRVKLAGVTALFNTDQPLPQTIAEMYLHYRSLEGSVKSSLPERLDEAGLEERLKTAANADKVPSDLLNVDWQLVARDGDAERGRKLFGADGIGCVKCHSTSDGDASQGGPSLAGTRKRFTVPYLVESILLPDRQVSQLFKATTIVTAEGRLHEGLVVGETGDKLELLLRTAERIEIDKSSVEQRKLQDLSPMPSGLVRTPHELRDILAFLLQLD